MKRFWARSLNCRNCASCYKCFMNTLIWRWKIIAWKSVIAAGHGGDQEARVLKDAGHLFVDGNKQGSKNTGCLLKAGPPYKWPHLQKKQYHLFQIILGGLAILLANPDRPPKSHVLKSMQIGLYVPRKGSLFLPMCLQGSPQSVSGLIMLNTFAPEPLNEMDFSISRDFSAVPCNLSCARN